MMAARRFGWTSPHAGDMLRADPSLSGDSFDGTQTLQRLRWTGLE
jgi:hypothetical protein